MRERKEHERRRMKESRNSERAPRKKTSERGSESYQPRKIGETNAKRESGPELDSAIEDFTWRSQHRLKIIYLPKQKTGAVKGTVDS